MKRTFVELPTFSDDWKKLKMSEEDLREVQTALLANPASGTVLSECGGIRKLRWGRQGTGKSGGIRIFYYDWPTKSLTFFLAVIAKSKKENLIKSERNALASLVHSIKEKYYE
jgi:hypothetical protein